MKISHLSTAFDIAKKISFQNQKSNTSINVKLSIIATSISVAAIIMTLSIVNGFQETISQKVFSFWGHIRIESVNGAPLVQNDSVTQTILSDKNIESITPFISQSTVISYKQEIEGVLAKGIPSTTSTPFLIKGRSILASKDSIVKEIVLSDILAKKLNIGVNEIVRLYFLNNGSVQQRKLKVVGLYHTGIEEYDQQFIIVDLKLLQQLDYNNNNSIEGYSITLKQAAQLDEIKDNLQQKLPKNWVSITIPNYYPQLFDWINIQTINRNVAITIMLIIAIVNLITCLFILMLERIPMIGTLTALGASHSMIRKIFIYQASFICWIGIGIGAITGIGLSLLQLKFGWIQLDESAYFIRTLPIKIIPIQIISIIMGTAVVSYLSFLLPTLWIKKISPAKTIQFD